MEEKAVRGIPWSLLAFSGSKAVTVAATVILAHLLSPTDFGLVALALLVFEFLNLFSDGGLTAVLVSRQDLDERAKGTLLTLLLVLGACIAILLAALAPLVSDLFEEPRLTDVLRALAVMAFISGFGWFYGMVLQRELEFRKRFLSHLTRSVAAAAVSLTFAFSGAGVWSLVAGQLAGEVSYAAAVAFLTPYYVRPTLDLRASRNILSSGRGFLMQYAAEFLQQNADYFSVGRFLGTAQLGFYSMAYRIGELPYAAVANPIARVTFPSFARMRDAGEDVAPAFLTGLRLVGLATCPLGVILSAAATPFTEGLLGEKWLPAVGPLVVIGLWAAMRPLESTVVWFLNSVDEARLAGRVSMLLLVPLLPGASLAAAFGSTTAVAWVLLCHSVILFVGLAVLAGRRTSAGLGSQWQALRPIFLAGLGTWFAVRAAVGAAGEVPALLIFFLSAALGLVVYAGLLRVVAPPLLGQALHQARRTLGRAPTPAG